MVHKVVALLALLGSFGVVVVVAPSAGASCVGPQVQVLPAEFARGDRVTISGRFWGDDCNDVRMAGDVEPVLGDPVDPITISFVQGATRIPVARGAASKRYTFTVPVRVPASLAPGSVDVVASGHVQGGTRDVDVPAGRLQITDAAPKRVTRKVKVVKFGR